MSYTYTPSGSVTNTDRAAVSAFMADLMTANSAGHPYGIATGSGDPSIATQASGGFAEAFADGMLLSVGYLGQNYKGAIATATTSATSFGDVGDGTTTGFPSWTVSSPLTKTYVLHVDLSVGASTGAGYVFWQVSVSNSLGTTTYTLSDTVGLHTTINSTSFHYPQSFRIAIGLQKGSNTIKLQWKVQSVTAQVDTSDFRCFTLTG